MDDAFKLLRPRSGESLVKGDRKPDADVGGAVHKPAQEPIDAPDGRARRNVHLPQSERALNKWLAERREKGREGLVNILNETHVTQFGPLKVKGNITLIHEDGSLELANQLSLCRCGHSKNKPFCDEQHIEAEFKCPGRFAQGSEAPTPMRPVPLAVTCVENGPLQFVGRMRIQDYLGQQCTKMRGSLCRCGHSANKPFCDGSHERVGFKTSAPKPASS